MCPDTTPPRHNPKIEKPSPGILDCYTKPHPAEGAFASVGPCLRAIRRVERAAQLTGWGHRERAYSNGARRTGDGTKRPQLERDPFLAVIDNSGSLPGLPAQLTRALAPAPAPEVAHTAHAEKRRRVLYA